MLDRVDLWDDGGAAGLGQLRGQKDVDPHEWFFKAHFFQDPVQPGSLGIEAMIQLLQFYMLETGMGEGILDARFEPLALGRPLTWKYRGQVVPTNKLIQSTMEITERGKDADGNPYAVADASLWVDGKRIYEAKHLAMRIVSGVPTEKRRRVLDPAVDRWLGDHQPTWTVPALPMMSMIDLLAQHADGPVTGLTDIKVKRWLTFAEAREVWTRQDGDRVTLFADGPEEVASARVRVGDYRQPPASFAPIVGEVVEDPYASGLLFHGPAFQRLRSLTMGANGSSAILDASPTSVPVGALHPVLLDAATHGIPHDGLHRWESKIGVTKVAYPAFVPELEVFSAPPTTGTIRAEVRYAGLFAPDMPAFEVQLVRPDGTLWARMKLVEACFPKGPLGLAAPADRRAFLRDRQFVEGVRLSRSVEGVTRLSAAEVQASDWLPGTVERVYGTREVAGIAVREHLAADQELHPGVVFDALPLTRHHTKITTEGRRRRRRVGAAVHARPRSRAPLLDGMVRSRTVADRGPLLRAHPTVRAARRARGSLRLRAAVGAERRLPVEPPGGRRVAPLLDRRQRSPADADRHAREDRAPADLARPAHRAQLRVPGDPGSGGDRVLRSNPTRRRSRGSSATSRPRWCRRGRA